MLKRTVSLKRFFCVPTTYVSGWEIKKIVFQYALLSGGLDIGQVRPKSGHLVNDSVPDRIFCKSFEEKSADIKNKHKKNYPACRHKVTSVPFSDGLAHDFSPSLVYQCNSPSINGLLLGTFWRQLMCSKSIIFRKFFQEYHQSVNQFGSRSGPTCWAGLIWIQTHCEDQQQTTKFELIFIFVSLINFVTI